MPELPEVETVRRGLEALDLVNDSIKKIYLSNKPLRVNAHAKDLKKVCGQELIGFRRKAKYLLFELENYVLLSHLGMTGSWRLEDHKKDHDHIRIHLTSGRVLTYRDPRRFGMFEVLVKEDWQSHNRFQHLGPDPVSDAEFTEEYLYSQLKKRKTPIKAAIMNQEIVVGVGNIYASEALFLAGIHPLTLASKLTKSQVKLLCEAIIEVLLEAIEYGGTTISDFKQAGGSEGYFQNLLLAYGRDKEECRFCGTALRSQFIVGRNSFWCPKCQKKR